MKKLPTSISNCWGCPYVAVLTDMGFGVMHTLKCGILWKNIPDEGVLEDCPLDDDLPDITKQDH